MVREPPACLIGGASASQSLFRSPSPNFGCLSLHTYFASHTYVTAQLTWVGGFFTKAFHYVAFRHKG